MTICRKRLSINGRDKRMIRNRCSFQTCSIPLSWQPIVSTHSLHPAYFRFMDNRRRWHVPVVSHAHESCLRPTRHTRHTDAASSQRSIPRAQANVDDGSPILWPVSLVYLSHTTSSFYFLPLFALSTGNILYLTQHIMSVYINIKILGIYTYVVH